MNQAALHRLAWVALLLAVAYALALWQPVRDWYSDVDKLAHGLVFAGVYAALAWALRWKPWELAALALALGAAVEVHQFFLPGFSASLKDWLADAVGIGLACGAHLAWRRQRYMSGLAHSDARLFVETGLVRLAAMAVPLRDGRTRLCRPECAVRIACVPATKGKFFIPLQGQTGEAPCARRYPS